MKGSKQSPVKKTVSNTRHKQPQQPKETVAGGSSAKYDPICDICAQNLPGPEREEIFALGKCDHSVCYVCMARLRAICDQFECPICRLKLDEVVLTSKRTQQFSQIKLANCIRNEKYGIYFENETIKATFEKLLKFECLECAKQPSQAKQNLQTATSANGRPAKKNSNKDSDHQLEAAPSPQPPTNNYIFSDVLGLKTHLKLKHKLELCELCLKHDKLFPFEYSYYNSFALRDHIRKGEAKTSHNGHPECELCHNLFFNKDELLFHMGRAHFSCHLCGGNSCNMMIYFLNFEDLTHHFKVKHFLCERQNCKHDPLTSAFDNELEYQMHVLQVHAGSTCGLSRGETRQQRTITLESAPHRTPAPSRQSTSSVSRNAVVVSTGPVASANSARPQQQIPESIRVQIPQQRLPSNADFPTLGNGGATSHSGPSSGQQYPSLSQSNPPVASSATVSTTMRLQAGPSRQRDFSSFVRSAGGGVRPAEQLNETDFPPLPEQPAPKGLSNKSSQKNSQNKARATREQGLALDQLISSSLTLSSRNTNINKNSNKKSQKPHKPNKSSKPKPLKIQL